VFGKDSELGGDEDHGPIIWAGGNRLRLPVIVPAAPTCRPASARSVRVLGVASSSRTASGQSALAPSTIHGALDDLLASTW
jgi:hypothetical protein